MQSLTNSGYIPEELFSQKGSTAKDAKFDKSLMADLSRQARHPMTVVSVDAAYCYDRVNHVIMSLVWLVLTNGNIPAEVLPMLWFWQIQSILWREILFSIHDGARTREQSSSFFMDPVKHSSNYNI
jgi:hypothetical protein